MGARKPVERTGEIENIAPYEVRQECCQIRVDVNHLEHKLERDFPEVNEATADLHTQIQEALHHYYTGLADARGVDRIKKSEVIAIEDDSYHKLIPNFLRYLSQFGEVGIGSHIHDFQGVCRIGVFLKKGDDKYRLLGLLGIKHNPEQKEYSGYVPTNLSEREFHGCSVYHLSSSDLGKGNFAFVNLLCEERAGKIERVDGFEAKGIKFP